MYFCFYTKPLWLCGVTAREFSSVRCAVQAGTGEAEIGCVTHQTVGHLRQSHSAACPAAPGPRFSEPTNTSVHPAPPGSIWSSLGVLSRLESTARSNSRPESQHPHHFPRAYRMTFHPSRMHPSSCARGLPQSSTSLRPLFLMHPFCLHVGPGPLLSTFPSTAASGPLLGPASAHRHALLLTPHRTALGVALIPRSL